MKLIICDTYSQLIEAIQMKITLFKDDVVDIRISDHSVGAEMVSDRLQRLNIFNNVYFVKTKKFIYERTKLESLIDVLKYNFGSIPKVQIKLYDEIIYYNTNLIIFAIGDYYKKIAHECIWSRMEEGLFSYDTDFESGFRVEYTKKLRKFIRRENVINNVSNYYCYFPKLKKNKWGWNIVKIPALINTKDRLVNILNTIFDYKYEDIKEKVIFFASSSDVDGEPYGETELILKIAKILQEKNVIVKIHPRDNRTIYKEKGINVMKNSLIPWELIQMNLQGEKKILLTVNSGAFVSITALLDDNLKGYFLFDEISEKNDKFNKREREIRETIKLLHYHNLAKNLNIGSIEDIVNEIEN